MEATVGPDGGFITSVTLLPRRASTFQIEARSAAGQLVVVSPPALTIVQGLTIGDPPLSRTLGVALANGHVQVYLERGAPLPARRTFTHHTIETVARGSSESVLRIPIVQGERNQLADLVLAGRHAGYRRRCGQGHGADRHGGRGDDRASIAAGASCPRARWCR